MASSWVASERCTRPPRAAGWTSSWPPEARARLAALAHVGPAPGDDHLADRRPAAPARLALAQVHVLGGREPPGRAQRVDLGAVERLVGIDVADARDLALVEQHRLDG